MPLGARERRILSDLNNLLLTFDLPVLEHLSEVSFKLLIRLYECLKGERLERTRLRDANQGQAHMAQFKALLDAMSGDVKGLNLTHLDTSSLFPQRAQRLDFLELYTSLGRVIVISRDLDAKSSTQSPSSAHLAEEETQSTEADETCTEISNGSTFQMQMRARDLFDNKKLAHLQSPTQVSDSPRTIRATRRRIARKQARLRQPAQTQDDAGLAGQVQQSTEKRYNRIDDGHARQTDQIDETARYSHGEALDEYHVHCPHHRNCPSDDTLTARAMNNSLVSPCRTKTPDKRTRSEIPFVKDEMPSFYSEQSRTCTRLQQNQRQTIIDSPYTKYLRARRDLVLNGLGNKLSPLRNSPRKAPTRRSPTKSFNTKVNRFAEMPCHAAYPLPRVPITRTGNHLSNQLLSSMAGSRNSDQSFYVD